MYASHEDDDYSRTFTMALMVGLAIMGSLVMVNLLVAIIVSDIGELRREAHLQVTLKNFKIILCFTCHNNGNRAMSKW